MATAAVTYVAADAVVANAAEARVSYISAEAVISNNRIPFEGSALAAASASLELDMQQFVITSPAPKTTAPTVCALSARIYTRGGHAIADIPPFASCGFSRRLDETASATLRIPAGVKFTAREWVHELVIVDDNNIVQFAGPVTGVEDGDDDESVIQARDLTSWFDHRFVARDRSYTDEDLAAIFAQLARDALEADPSPNINVVTQDCDVRGDREYLAIQFDYVGDKLRELARTGVDFTTVGRHLLIGGVVTSTDVWKLASPMVEKVRRPRQGLHLANDVGVIGATVTDGDGVTATIVGRSNSPSSIDDLGLLQARFNESDILDQGSANVNARTRKELMSDPVGDITVQLREGEYALTDLICGRPVDVDLPAARFAEQSLGGVTGRRRLSAVTVDFSAAGIRTSVTLQPEGTEE